MVGGDLWTDDPPPTPRGASPGQPPSRCISTTRNFLLPPAKPRIVLPPWGTPCGCCRGRGHGRARAHSCPRWSVPPATAHRLPSRDPVTRCSPTLADCGVSLSIGAGGSRRRAPRSRTGEEGRGWGAVRRAWRRSRGDAARRGRGWRGGAVPAGPVSGGRISRPRRGDKGRSEGLYSYPRSVRR